MSESIDINTGDLVSLKKRIADLEAENSHLRKLYDRAPLSYQSLDEDGCFIDVNQAWLDTLGYSRDEVIGKNFSEFLVPEWSNHFRVNFPKFKALGEILGVEFQMVKKDGTTIFVAFHGKIDKNPQGKFVQTHCIFEDITSRIEYENKLKESESKFKSLFEKAADGIFMMALDGRILDVNSAAQKQTGHGREELLKMKIRDLDPQAQTEWDNESIWEKIHLGEVTTLSTQLLRKDGTQFPSEISLTRYTIDEEVFLLAFVRDVTEKREKEKQLRQSQKLESIGTLAGGIAHDFNNILSSVIGFTELAIDDTKENTTQHDNLKEVLAASMRAKELVQQILTFARKSEETIKSVELGSIVNEVIKLIRSTVPTTIEIVKNIEGPSPILASPSQIHQVLLNLCTNSAQAMHNKGGVLEVTMKNILFNNSPQKQRFDGLSQEHVELTVSDTGSGIDPVFIDKIFDPYFTTKKVGEGSGLGLAIAKGIIESHGGLIEVSSTPNYGTTFTIRLPLALNEAADKPSIETTLKTGCEHILLIDDEPAIVSMTSRMLERLGYTVTPITDCVEALNVFRNKSESFDLIITDMTMPHMTGDVLSMELRKIRADIPIILCSGYSSKINQESAKAVGLNAYLNKPFSKTDISVTVREVLDTRQKS